MKKRLFVGFIILLALNSSSWGADEKRYPEATHDKGELKYVSGVPVLVVEGTPEEIGEQFGILATKPAKQPLIDKFENYMKKAGYEKEYPLMMRTAGFFMPMFPENNQKEMNAVAKASGVPRNVLIVSNAMPDLQKIGACSTIIIEPERSKTKAPLFGRILDWPPHENLAEFTLVTVIRQPKKHAIATVTFPVILGCISGMNDVGLCISINQIDHTKDGSAKSDTKGVPMLMLFRKILEECTTVDEAEKMLRESKRTTMFCVTACDKKGGCVFEVTTKNVIARKGVECVCCCTNHFRTDELSVTDKCKRYEILQKTQKNGEKFGVDEVKAEMHKVSQGDFTVHAIVFEPAERVMHLAYGGGKSATEKKLTRLELGSLFEKGHSR